MGEAKRRAASEPTFGRVPKKGRGLIISAPTEIDGRRIKVFGDLDRQEMRMSLLFWDRLVWPLSRLVHVEGGPDEKFLESEGILTRPKCKRGGVIDAHTPVREQVETFLDLDIREPGNWALAQGRNSLLIKEHTLEQGRGALLELHRAIPVPDKEVPIQDILEFKIKRHDELRCLRDHIDMMYMNIDRASDKKFALNKCINKIDAACADVLKVSKEAHLPLRLADLKATFDLRPFATIAAIGGAWLFGKEYEMPLAASAVAIAGLLSTAGLSISFGLRGLKIRSSPYRYVYHFHNEVF